MLTKEQKEQFNGILEELGKNLDISEAQYNTVVKSYEAVGLHLAKHDSILGKYNPEILPQGSFMLGTMIKPVNENDDLDIDLVCQLTGKVKSWTQYDLKQAVGDQLRSHGTYNAMIKRPEGRRCWTLVYSDAANYHLDILPCIVDAGYRILLEKAFSHTELKNLNELAIRITDRQLENYKTETNHLAWLKSNPFGYGRWFFQQATLDFVKSFSINEAIEPVPPYNSEKLPLQRIVQILKRHRDIMFNGNEDKPISIIITTLAAKAYEKQTDVLSGLLDVVERMALFIEDRYDYATGKTIKWISNPVNEEENYADKWVTTPAKQENFFKWMKQLKSDLQHITAQRGMHNLKEAFAVPFGKDTISKAFSNIGEKVLYERESGGMRMAAVTGTLGSIGSSIKQHTNHGQKEE